MPDYFGFYNYYPGTKKFLMYQLIRAHLEILSYMSFYSILTLHLTHRKRNASQEKDNEIHLLRMKSSTLNMGITFKRIYNLILYMLYLL